MWMLLIRFPLLLGIPTAAVRSQFEPAAAPQKLPEPFDIC